ncbi:MAG: MiaB/RimO family radical SAM methylthiotransferase, partial [Oscillospiraceae bacterium]|nr:MiaB/RimO family radical SAM methylthiotransferase [Oscillospiraceae bacterium]
MNEKIALISLGCAKNLINSEEMLSLIDEAGFELVSDPDGADGVIVNTCAFIESAKQEAIDEIIALGKLKDEGKLKKIIVCGCLSQRYKSELSDAMPEIDAMLGTGSYGDIVETLRRTFAGEKPALYGDINAPELETGRVVTTGPAWAYIKIAEGCSNRCAYCVIPTIRGRYRSRPMENIMEEAEALVSTGTRELIVIAQDITRYGTDLYGRRALPELLKKLCSLPDLKWIRLHYLYPDELDDELIDTVASEEKILKYLDIPIQHINDKILKTMNRRGS